MNSKVMGRSTLCFIVFVFLTLASPSMAETHTVSSNTVALAEQTDRHIGCAPQFEDEFWNSLYGFALSREDFADPEEVRQILRHTFENGRLKELKPIERERLIEVIVGLYRLLSSEALDTLGIDKSQPDLVLEALTNLEMGDRDSPEKTRIQDKIRSKFDEIHIFISSFPVSKTCPPPIATPPSEPEANALIEHWKETRHPVVYGALKTLANSYQSCEVGKAPALSSRTPDIKGIVITGRHPDGVGNKRLIGDLTALIRSHPYLAEYRRPAASCHDILQTPLIYDYGGKPYATNHTDSSLDFFRDAGSGTSVLGADCSGYVYAAFATAGLKLKKTGRLKAINVLGVPARMYMNPQKNGLTCFNHVVFSRTRSLRPGDILASSGHVLVINDVGADPFGIQRITREADCKAENIDIARFDFTVLHSSPVKGGIGINHMQGSHYLAEGGSMANAMIQHAVSACLAKVRNTTITSRSSPASLVHHLGTAECRDRPIPLTREECLTSC